MSKYVGAYEYTPGSVDTISLEGDRIFATSTGEAKVEIFAESETAFFAKGQPWRLVFLADGGKLWPSASTARSICEANEVSAANARPFSSAPGWR